MTHIAELKSTWEAELDSFTDLGAPTPEAGRMKPRAMLKEMDNGKGPSRPRYGCN